MIAFAFVRRLSPVYIFFFLLLHAPSLQSQQVGTFTNPLLPSGADPYLLGLLRFTGADDLLDTAQWEKSPVPVFTQSAANDVYASGHNSFFVSPNGKENWLLYHANSNPGDGCGNKRSPRAQKFTWNSDGTPHFGLPAKEGEVMAVPAEK